MLAAEVFDALAELGMFVKEGMRDAGFALHGRKGYEVNAFDERSDRLIGGVRCALRFRSRGGSEYGDPAVSGAGHGVLLRSGIGPRVSGTGPALGRLHCGVRSSGELSGVWARASMRPVRAVCSARRRLSQTLSAGIG